jgi:hypothetical protein
MLNDDPEMSAELAAYDAELIAREGPDALTSDRALRLSLFKRQQAAEREAALWGAEGDADRVGYVLAAFRQQSGWSRWQLAAWLGLSVFHFKQLSREPHPTGHPGEVRIILALLARRYGVHAERL